ncbi:MAG TPA: hypothetical protein VFP94_08765 [Terriglobales bacterium]|nr:hypothetical protein [Terriglobales bacterium]
MTSEDLLTARAAQFTALRPLHLDAASLRAWIAALGLATLPELGEAADAAAELLEDELRELRLVELWLWHGIHRYCTPEILGYVYVAVGDRHPDSDFRQQAEQKQISWLAAEVYEALLAAPAAMTSGDLRDCLGAERTSALTIEQGLHDLARTLKVVRCGHVHGEAQWRPLAAALPAIPPLVDKISLPQAVSALISQRLQSQVCATEDELAAFFAPLFSRTRIQDALRGLERARALRMENVDGRPAWRLS